MSKQFIENIKRAKWQLGFLFAFTFYNYRIGADRALKEYFFGADGMDFVI